MKVIYVSDSLGTPIHARGIFSYSVSLVEILKQLGASVDLVVEGAPGFGLDRRLRALGPASSPAVSSVELSEIHRYFNESKFSFAWPSKYVRLGISIARITLLHFYYETLKNLLGRSRGKFVKNEPTLIDFVPPGGEHLKNLDGFILRNRFYWSSMRDAITGLAPLKVDARGYDLAVVDTPHFVKLEGIAPDRILAVVHDLIPLRDPSIDTNWRFLFIKKLQATLAMRSTLIFVSEYTRDVFHQSFPHHKTRKEIILYPAIKSSLTCEADDPGGATATGSLESLLNSDFVAEYDMFDSSLTVGKKAKKDKKPKRKHDQRRQPSEPWDAGLPYFATALSDEPRKNVGILVKAFKLLKGRANIVIIGHIDANRHLGGEPADPANVRFTGYLTESEKIRIFRGAAGLVFPSFAEGFGIPLVEGAVMGLPVLCSDIPVFREVAGDNAIYFNPYDPRSLIAAIERILADPATGWQKAELMRLSVLARFSQKAVARRLTAALAELGLAVESAPSR